LFQTQQYFITSQNGNFLSVIQPSSGPVYITIKAGIYSAHYIQ